MDRNVRIARELAKIAKMLVADDYTEDKYDINQVARDIKKKIDESVKLSTGWCVGDKIEDIKDDDGNVVGCVWEAVQNKDFGDTPERWRVMERMLDLFKIHLTQHKDTQMFFQQLSRSKTGYVFGFKVIDAVMPCTTARRERIRISGRQFTAIMKILLS